MNKIEKKGKKVRKVRIPCISAFIKGASVSDLDLR